MLKKFTKIEELNITLVPISMDEEINSFLENFVSENLVGKKLMDKSLPYIGLNVK